MGGAVERGGGDELTISGQDRYNPQVPKIFFKLFDIVVRRDVSLSKNHPKAIPIQTRQSAGFGE